MIALLRLARRITNLYTTSRLLYYSKVNKGERGDMFLKKLTHWIMLCEQWPTRISLILQV